MSEIKATIQIIEHDDGDIEVKPVFAEGVGKDDWPYAIAESVSMIWRQLLADMIARKEQYQDDGQKKSYIDQLKENSQ